jgi:hypothetical protein
MPSRKLQFLLFYLHRSPRKNFALAPISIFNLISSRPDTLGTFSITFSACCHFCRNLAHQKTNIFDWIFQNIVPPQKLFCFIFRSTKRLHFIFSLFLKFHFFFLHSSPAKNFALAPTSNAFLISSRPRLYETFSITLLSFLSKPRASRHQHLGTCPDSITSPHFFHTFCLNLVQLQKLVYFIFRPMPSSKLEISPLLSP